jgi:hypothetical protein
MSPCTTSPAPTPLQLSLRSQLTLRSWLSKLVDLTASPAIAKSPGQNEIAATIDKINAAFLSLEQEGEVEPNTLVAEAMQTLRLQIPAVHAATATMLANADRRLGREEFLQIFALNSGAETGSSQRRTSSFPRKRESS